MYDKRIVCVICAPSKNPERKRSLEQLSFQSGQVSSRVLAKPELLATGFLAILQLCPELPPRLVIARLQISRLQVLTFAHHHRHQTNGAAHHHTGNGSSASGRPTLMGTSD